MIHWLHLLWIVPTVAGATIVAVGMRQIKRRDKEQLDHLPTYPPDWKAKIVVLRTERE